MRFNLKIASAVVFGMVIGALGMNGLSAQTKSPAAYFVTEAIQVTDQAAFMQAVRDSNAKHRAHGARYLALGGRTHSVAGDAPSRITIIAFDSFEQAKNWFGSAEYAQINAAIQKSAKTRSFIVEGVAE